jgi:hypothetical protein
MIFSWSSCGEAEKDHETPQPPNLVFWLHSRPLFFWNLKLYSVTNCQHAGELSGDRICVFKHGLSFVMGGVVTVTWLQHLCL